MPAEEYGYPLPQALAGWGLPAEACGYLLPKARAGWGLLAEACGEPAGRRRGQGMPARSKTVGVWETGEGEQVPPPRQPLPPWRYPHGPQHGENLEKSRIRFPTGSIPDTAARLISPRTDPAPSRGRGRSAAGAGGVGVPEGYGYPCEGAGGVGVPEGYGYPCEGAGGVGAAGRRVWVSLRRRGRGGGGRQGVYGYPCEGAGGVGAAGEVHGYPAASRVGAAGESEDWDLETGEGGSVPLPVSLSPDGDIHHGPLHGDKPGKTRARLSTRYRHARTPPPGCDKKPKHGLRHAIPSVRDIPTAACIPGNGNV